MVLNPIYYYASNKMAKRNALAKLSVTECADTFFRDDVDIIDRIHAEEMLKYKESSGVLSRDIIVRIVQKIETTRDPGDISLNFKLQTY